ncbi:MAG: type II toxin-antitoxin system HicB family antitoxin [Chloroflexi bacterium]|nr:type II toxin-antitoxin system HicB family antitoxin [Chloroflexota bacterium]
MLTYQVEVSLSKQEDGLWRAEVPALPGCFVDSDTIEEDIQDIQEGIQLFIASYKKHGDPLPEEFSAVTDSDLPHSLKLLVSVA